MVTKEELYKHPKVVERIKEEVEKQRGEKLEDLEGIRLNLAFTWKESIEGEDIWHKIHHNSNFQPFYEFHKMQDQTVEETPKVYTIKEVIEQGLVVNTKTLSEAKRIVKGFKSEGFYEWVEGKRSEEILFEELKTLLCFNIETGGYTNIKFYKELGLTIIDSTQVVTNSEIHDTIITENNEKSMTGEISGKIEKTQIDPNDLKEGDTFYNALYGNSKYKVVRGDRGDLYGLCEDNMVQIAINNRFNSFTPYNIVSGGATFERPVVYPKEREIVFEIDSSDLYVPYYFDSNKDKEAFKYGKIITAEAYFKLVNEYNSKL